MTGEQELDLLKRQAGDIKKELDRIESRMRDLEKGKKE
jgi:archaellum component FlaC